METPERLDRSYRQLAADRGVPVAFLQALHQALGFAPPEPGDQAGEDDATMLDIAELFRGAGGGDDATLRLLAVYADSLRRIAKAEADYYETNIGGASAPPASTSAADHSAAGSAIRSSRCWSRPS